jgi:hypothetical protein
MNQYYLDEDKKPQGPFSLHSLEGMVEELPARTRCCKKGDDKWLPIEVVIASHISNHLGTNDKMGKLVAFVNEELSKVLVSDPEAEETEKFRLNFHIRTQWKSKSVPVNELDISQLEWKFHREDRFSTYTYYGLRVTPDHQAFFISHSNSSVGAFTLKRENGSHLPLSNYYDGSKFYGYSGSSLSDHIKSILLIYEPNRMDIS